MEINLTFIFQILNGLVSLWVLKHFLIRPFFIHIAKKTVLLQNLIQHTELMNLATDKLSHQQLLELNLFQNQTRELIQRKTLTQTPTTKNIFVSDAPDATIKNLLFADDAPQRIQELVYGRK